MIGRALRAPLGQIVKLAGYDPTGAEELPVIDQEPQPVEPAKPSKIPDAIKPTGEQIDEPNGRLRRLEPGDFTMGGGEGCSARLRSRVLGREETAAA